jgi:hypothetical protein
MNRPPGAPDPRDHKRRAGWALGVTHGHEAGDCPLERHQTSDHDRGVHAVRGFRDPVDHASHVGPAGTIHPPVIMGLVLLG